LKERSAMKLRLIGFVGVLAALFQTAGAGWRW
jgi:hypothetical protein